MKTISKNDLHRFIKTVFLKCGSPENDAKIIADVLIDADLKGIDSHGVSRLKRIYYDRIKNGTVNPITKIDILKDSVSTCLIDGNNGMGHVISFKAMEIAINKAKKTGTATVAVKNSSHYGIAGYYTDYAANNNMICITGTNARPSVAPVHGTNGMLGTNPLTIGIPTNEAFNFNIDCATSVTQRGKIELYARENKALPDNWVKDNSGIPVIDSNKALDMLKQGIASFIPLGGITEETGGHKGYGYSIAIEILSAALQNGPYLKMLNGIDENGNNIPYLLGHFFIVIDPSHFIDIKLFKQIAGNILTSLRNSKRKSNEQQIFTPGEKEYISKLNRIKNGIPITDNLLKEMRQIYDELSLTGFDEIFI